MSMNIKKILIIIRQANGDVLLSSPVVNAFKKAYPDAQIDLVVNESTVSMAQAIPHVSEIYAYCYSWRKKGFFYRVWKEFSLFKKLWRKYDVSLSLTASDRSILLAITSGKCAVGVLEDEIRKSWWKQRYLNHSYYFDPTISMILNNKKPLELLNIIPDLMELRGQVDAVAREKMRRRLEAMGVEKFVIFHPSARDNYKVYPTELRNRLLNFFNQEKIAVLVTGGGSELDLKISQELPVLPYIYNFIGQCGSILDLLALTDLSEAYMGMDTLNMHIAASLDKPIFAIFGPTNPSVWSPWSNALQCGAKAGASAVQQYGNITLFQATLPCVPCFKAGCDNRGIKSDCLSHISPDFIWSFFNSSRLISSQRYYKNNQDHPESLKIIQEC